jgi:hypothetical protein
MKSVSENFLVESECLGFFTRSFNIKFRYIDDVLSLNNSWFGDFVDRIYPIELEIKDTTHTDTSAVPARLVTSVVLI